MTIFGLGPGAQVIILQALSAYSAIFSAWFFARPVLRGQAISVSKEILSDVKSDDADLQALLSTTIGTLNSRSDKDRPANTRDNEKGYGLLVISLLLLTAAVVLQIETDASFARASPQNTAPSSQTTAPNLPNQKR